MLPARVPIHWDLHGKVNGWGSPLTASMLFPTIATVIYLGILAYDWGRIDFKAARAMSPSVARQVRLLVLLLMGVLQVTLLRAVMQGHPPSTSIVVLGISLFLILLGNVLPRTEPNAWGGIRIPPTLESREVWKRTHRFFGKWLVVAGLLGIPACLLPEATATLFILPQVLIPTMGAIVYAYWIRHRMDHSSTSPSEAP
ncbi:MAG TPA: SdpI family protein [Geothrix sp.]